MFPTKCSRPRLEIWPKPGKAIANKSVLQPAVSDDSVGSLQGDMPGDPIAYMLPNVDV